MLRKRILPLICLTLIALLALVSCIINTASESSDTSSDTNTEISTGTDTNTNTDTSTNTATNTNTDSSTNTDTDNTDTSTNTSTDSNTSSDDSSETEQSYFVATVKNNVNITFEPYVGNATVNEALCGIYYSASSPGGAPRDDGTGSIWLTVKPLKDVRVTTLSVSGEYSFIEQLENDVYCIHGVKSNLTVNAYTATLTATDEKLFEDYGYGITDNGILLVTWNESEENPLRYVEISYTDSNGSTVKYYDADLGKAYLLIMNESEIYSLSVRAIGKEKSGKKFDFNCCYMTEPKSISFPRIEITTENYVWPECDFVSSPDGCWGAGITNALYEGCVMTLYNESNQVVYSSGSDFDGAKLKIRGNTSARYASSGRYPYKLKLDEKFDLLAPLIGRENELDGYADRDWVLLNYGNDGYRICGDAIADAVGTEWSPDYCYVTLYVNGEYRGLYVLSEAVEEGNGSGDEQWRVCVDDDGYVFECDAYWWNEDLSFNTPLSEKTPMHYTLKYPDPDDSPDYTYLQDYITRFENALKKNDDSYLEYIDLDSFVKWLLVSDYLSIKDGGGCNIFLYKKDSTDQTKLCMGPNWDFDSYMGGIFSLATIRMKWDGAPFYFQYLIEKQSFQKRYAELFEQTRRDLENAVNEAFAKIDIEAHTQLLQYDNARFGTSKTTLDSRRDKFILWLAQHVSWMETQIN